MGVPRSRRSVLAIGAALTLSAVAAVGLMSDGGPSACRDMELAVLSGIDITYRDVERYLGLDLAQAEALGRNQGVAVRVVCRDGRGLISTADLRPDRVNIGLDEGVVVGATAY